MYCKLSNTGFSKSISEYKIHFKILLLGLFQPTKSTETPCSNNYLYRECKSYKPSRSEKQTQTADVHPKIHNCQHLLNLSRLTVPQLCCTKLIGYVRLINHGQLLHKQEIWAAKENYGCKYILC